MKQDGLSDILNDLEYNPEINPKHSPKTINKIKRIIQPYVSGELFWTYDDDKGICPHCQRYTLLNTCSDCDIDIVSYDVENVDDVYLNLSSSSNKQVIKFLNELQGNIGHSCEEWNRIRSELDSFFDGNYVFDKTRQLVGGVLPSTSASLMREALSMINECTNDSFVYYACLHYWNWEVFDFSRYIDAYRSYITKIDFWCSGAGVKLNKMFKYYWVSLVIGFDVSKHYFRFPDGSAFVPLRTIARNISRSRGIPIPSEWIV